MNGRLCTIATKNLKGKGLDYGYEDEEVYKVEEISNGQ